ncbi:type I-E CRISPR-associated protein Cas7/Cse4/CasC [Corynebacterium striatum]|uniref:type I-E CRISPR-associated protein Cas7/Cse4/CasC n=1 Tax=Corynebacterium striatum TaxID=43770 RepID=UPI000D764B04|nr:type I-E CRISPR-associated protein Cas7/Cse4/CasC [Corynebacterium striatum]PXY14559.1 type I-E CRISPR-associated protein Cas7/Cse4/CasC [Corynebacterium striatum]
MSLTVDVHVLQTIPPSLINRDDMGAPKSARYGGVQRQRVSSQAWKRAVRQDFAKRFPAEVMGKRTRLVGELICKRIFEITEEAGEKWETQRAIDGVKNLFTGAKLKLKDAKSKNDETEEDAKIAYPELGYLLFLGNHQIDRAARAIIDKDGEKFKKNEAQAILDTEHSIDIAMFGRMVADDAAFNVDASVQVAHALGIHETEPEFDYFTAVDDATADNEETGAGMIGTVQMMSSTLYRFASVDFESLASNLNDVETAVDSAAAFVDSFVKSLPTGKQNTFAHNTLPELVYVTISDDRSVSLVNAFEEPVEAGAAGRSKLGAEKLAQEAIETQRMYGLKPTAQFVAGIRGLDGYFTEFADSVTIPELEERVADVLNSLISEK